MEYTGKESYGGTVDDGGRREMDKVIGILEDLIANFTLHEDKRGLYVQSSAQAIVEALTPKGDEDGLLTDEQILSVRFQAVLLPPTFGDKEGYISKLTKAIAEAQQALTSRLKEEEFELRFNPDYLDFQKGVEAQKVLGQERVERIFREIEYNNPLLPAVNWYDALKKQEGL